MPLVVRYYHLTPKTREPPGGTRMRWPRPLRVQRHRLGSRVNSTALRGLALRLKTWTRVLTWLTLMTMVMMMMTGM